MPAKPIQATDHTATPVTNMSDAQNTELKLCFNASPLAVRSALQDCLSGIEQLNLSQDDQGTIEIVLAEILNNVVEHAYNDQHSGPVELNVKPLETQLQFSIIDSGKPMPNDVVPPPRPYELEGELDNLPEGGFGWSLVHELTTELTYSRHDQKNFLCFAMDVQTSQPT